MSAIAAELGCAQVYSLADDLYHDDSMRGFDCLLDHQLLMLRVYQESRSPAQALEGWDELITSARQLMLGTNWYAIGRPTSLDRLAHVLNVEPVHGTTLPVPEPVAPAQARMRGCSTAVATIVKAAAGLSPDPELARSYESTFAGISDFSNQVFNELRAEGEINPDVIEYDLSEHGPEIKSFCASAAK
ncbi:hypothetical protein [Microbacterium resistens]|uniref:hypothetical protein n=1 Tax=Microbacterium resistens TaxID=156977 RepID=UPI0022F143B7|nr:hypothetical protein [Streptomyces sp. MS2A]